MHVFYTSRDFVFLEYQTGSQHVKKYKFYIFFSQLQITLSNFKELRGYFCKLQVKFQ